MKTENRKESRSSHLLVLVFVMLAAGIITAGYFYYENYERQYRSEMERQLSAVADLKEHELVQWRKERLGDANVFYKNIVFSGLAKRYFENQSDADAKKRIKAFMGQVQAAYSYSRICLHDAAGVERISIPEGKIHSPFIFSLRSAEVLKSGKVEFQDFYRDENDKKVYLTIFIPVIDEYDASRVFGVLAMRIDPEQSLYPIISRWLTPSRTAEILIARREGNDILFLNELKYQKNTALSLRVSMENKKLPSVRAALGQQGIVEGVDYRGVPVLADVRKVPDSPWLLVARMDLSEVYAPVRERLWMIFVIVGLLLVSAGAGTGFLHRQQRMRFYLEQYKADEALRDSEERYRTTMMSVGDGVITTDSEGRLELLNPVAETLTGWRQEESSDKPLEEVFRIINEETRQIVENPVRRVMREGIVVGLANHSVLIAKDGTEHPIADSGAPIRNEKGEITGVVLVFRDQTQERMAQKALQESELKFRDTVKYLDEAYYSVTTDGLLIEHNQAYNRILGIDITQDLKGQKTPDFWQNPDERKVYLQELMTKGSIINYLINAKTISGKKVVVMANSHLVKDEKGGLVRIEGTFTDFTERKRAEEALRDANENLERRVLERTTELTRSKQLLDETGRLARVGGWELDLKNNLLSFSDVTKQIHEVDPEYQPTLEVAINFYAPEAVPVISEAVRRAIEDGESYDVELQLITAKQNRIWVRAIGQAYRENGEIVRIGGVFQDINERKLAEQEREALMLQIEHRSSLLEATNKELEAFTYSVSHDLRAPLRHMSGYVELLTSRFQSALTDKGKHYLNSIADSVHQMGKLIDNLLQYSRTGRAEMRRTELEMNAIVRETVESVHKDNPDRNIEWVVGKLPSVCGDDTTLRLVWMNLLSNAVKFTRTREKALIEIGAKAETKEVTYFVRDNGVGFDMKYAEKLFGVFQRLHSTEEFEGTGIGLANVHRIVVRHGGRTWAEAELNKGATFYFSIPK